MRFLLQTAVIAITITLCASIAFGSDRETQVKAAFFLNFARLVDWPGRAFERHPGTFNICIPAGDPLVELISTQQGKSVKGKNVVWKVYAGLDEAADCQIVFIPERRRIPQAIKATASRPVLLIGEQDGFCQAGGGINLISTDGRFGFEINLKALQQVDLKAGAQILKVAREVIQ